MTRGAAIKILIATEDSSISDRITQVLSSFSNDHHDISFDIYSVHSLSDLKRQVNQDSFDLLMIDIEFEAEGTSSIGLLETFPATLPIIIVSNLTHYEKVLSLLLNVIGFVPASQITAYLPFLLKQLFIGFSTGIDQEMFSFPVSKNASIENPYQTSRIRYILHTGRQHYRITFTDNEVCEITSSPVYVIRSALKKQGIKTIVPLSQNEFVNINLIKSIYKRRDGRYVVRLIGEPDIERVISPQFLSGFKILL